VPGTKGPNCLHLGLEKSSGKATHSRSGVGAATLAGQVEKAPGKGFGFFLHRLQQLGLSVYFVMFVSDGSVSR